MIPHYFTDAQLAELECSDEYNQRGHQCPVCLGEGSYVYKGVTHECLDDDYSHPMLRLAKLYWLHGIPLQYQTLIWDEYPDAQVKSEVENYLDKFKRLRLTGMGVTAFGTALGVGKTWTVTHILKEIVKQGYDGWFVEFYRMKSYFDMPDREQRAYLVSRLTSAEVLVIDDVMKPWGAEAQRALFEEKTEEVVRTRTNMNFPTLVTTNMTLDEFERYYPRVFSLLSAKNMEFELTGVDARKDGDLYLTHSQLAMKGETRPIT